MARQVCSPVTTLLLILCACTAQTTDVTAGERSELTQKNTLHLTTLQLSTDELSPGAPRIALDRNGPFSVSSVSTL